MPNQHRSSPISFRPTAADRAFLLQHAADTGRSVNDVLREALGAYILAVTDPGEDGPDAYWPGGSGCIWPPD